MISVYGCVFVHACMCVCVCACARVCVCGMRDAMHVHKDHESV